MNGIDFKNLLREKKKMILEKYSSNCWKKYNYCYIAPGIKILDENTQYTKL